MEGTPIKVSKIKSPHIHPIQSAAEKPDPDVPALFSDSNNAPRIIPLQEAWSFMLAKLLTEGRKYVHSALEKIKPELNNASEIEIPIEHDALRSALDALVFELTNLLRAKTGIQELQLKLITVSPDALSTQFSTLADKKQWLLDHYPKISPFIQKIGLDWSY